MNMCVNTPSEDDQLEAKLRKLGKNAPRVTPSEIDALHSSLKVLTHHFEGTTITVAVAILPHSNFAVAEAMSGSISKENFDAGIGVEVATKKVLAMARDKLWELEGYLLRDRIHRAAAEHKGEDYF